MDNSVLRELLELNQWVIRRSDKIPLQVAEPHSRASVNIPEHWSTFEVASAFVQSHPGYGLGFVITPTCPFSFIDLDNARDPKHKYSEEEIQTIIHNQNEIYAAFSSYTEFSPSKNGVHIIVRGKMPTNKKKKCIEVYSFGRYMTMTFDVVKGRNIPISDASELLKTLWDDMGGLTSSVSEIYEDEPETKIDEQITAQAAAASNGSLFLQLWEDKWKGDERYPSRSEAALALINIIAFYTDNRPQAVRIFRSSKLGKNSKYKDDNKFYHPKWGLVTKAFDQKGKDLSMQELIESCAAQYAEMLAAQAIEPPPLYKQAPEPSDIPDETVALDWPAGVVGGIAQYIYANAINPVKEVAIAAALAWFAGLVGRAYNYSYTGLNQYIILLANTGGGKGAASSGLDKLTQAISKNGGVSISRFIGPGVISSPQALVKYFKESDCFMSHVGEIGHWMQKICSKKAKDNDVQLRSALLDLFDKSGATQTLKGSIFAEMAKNSGHIEAPCFSLFGDSTPSEFYKALDENNIAEGLVSRLTIIECPVRKTEYSKTGNKVDVPLHLIEQLKRYLNKAMQMADATMVKHVAQTSEAEEYHLKLREKYDTFRDENIDAPTAQIWNRAHLRILRIAGLLAVGESEEQPLVTIENIKWAENLVMKSILNVIERFESGNVGELNYQKQQNELITRIIVKYCLSKYETKWDKNYSINEPMHASKVITYRYIYNNTVAQSCFKNDRNANLSFKNVIDTFIKMGFLRKVDLEQFRPGARGGEAWHVADLGGLEAKMPKKRLV